MSAAPDAFRVLEAVEEHVHHAPREALVVPFRRYRSEAGFEALIPHAVVQRLRTLSRRAAPNEWIGILVGRLGEDRKGTYVVVDGVVLDERALATPGSVRSTEEGEWAVRKIAEAAYAGSVVIGWAHGHHRCGTHFSAGDRTNQATWTAPHSLGIVCDPWSEEDLGVYRGPGSEHLALVSEGSTGGAPSTRGSLPPAFPEPGSEPRGRGALGARAVGPRFRAPRLRRHARAAVRTFVGLIPIGVASFIAWHWYLGIVGYRARLDLAERRIEDLERVVEAGEGGPREPVLMAAFDLPACLPVPQVDLAAQPPKAPPAPKAKPVPTKQKRAAEAPKQAKAVQQKASAPAPSGAPPVSSAKVP